MHRSYGRPDVPHLRQILRQNHRRDAWRSALRLKSGWQDSLRAARLPRDLLSNCYWGRIITASVGRIKRVDAQCSDNYRSLLCEVIDDFETCDELTAERGRTGPIDLRPCF